MSENTKEMGVVGSEEFILGFQLAGITHTFDFQSPETVNSVIARGDIGILVLDEPSMIALPTHVQDKLSRSVDPVVVTLSKEGGSADLREKIIRAVGIDLWKE